MTVRGRPASISARELLARARGRGALHHVGAPVAGVGELAAAARARALVGHAADGLREAAGRRRGSAPPRRRRSGRRAARRAIRSRSPRRGSCHSASPVAGGIASSAAKSSFAGMAGGRRAGARRGARGWRRDLLHVVGRARRAPRSARSCGRGVERACSWPDRGAGARRWRLGRSRAPATAQAATKTQAADKRRQAMQTASFGVHRSAGRWFAAADSLHSQHSQCRADVARLADGKSSDCKK